MRISSAVFFQTKGFGWLFQSSIQARSRFEKACVELGAKLRVLDIDRLFIDAALAEIQRVGRATRGLPFEGAVTFSTSTKAFADYVRTVAAKAVRLKAAKNEFVKANLRLVVSIARRFNHGRLPLADLLNLMMKAMYSARAAAMPRFSPAAAPRGVFSRR